MGDEERRNERGASAELCTPPFLQPLLLLSLYPAGLMAPGAASSLWLAFFVHWGPLLATHSFAVCELGRHLCSRTA